MDTGILPILECISLVQRMAGVRELTHASHEQYHTTDTKQASNVVDLFKDFCL